VYYIKYLDMFEQYYAHLQEVKSVFLQHLVSSLSVSRFTVHRLRADCSPLSNGALYGRVTTPDAVKIQFIPPEDEHSIARNMSRYLILYVYYRIMELCIKLVIETNLHYEARSEKTSNYVPFCSLVV
jgi:hypothetical protein